MRISKPNPIVKKRSIFLKVWLSSEMKLIETGVRIMDKSSKKNKKTLQKMLKGCPGIKGFERK